MSNKEIIETESNEKIEALAKYLECEVTEIYENGDRFEVGNKEYSVLTDEEANEKAAEYIKDSLWAFNAEFIIDHSKLPYEAVEMVKSYQEKKCESANETIETLIEDMDSFVEDAISADGRGHFMSTYDGEEHEEGEYFIYRTN